MYELKKMEKYLRVNLLVPDPRLIKKRIYQAAVSQRLRNTDVDYIHVLNSERSENYSYFISFS